MKMQSFFERFDAFFSVYNSIELDVEFNPSIQKFEITNEWDDGVHGWAEVTVIGENCAKNNNKITHIIIHQEKKLKEAQFHVK